MSVEGCGEPTVSKRETKEFGEIGEKQNREYILETSNDLAKEHRLDRESPFDETELDFPTKTLKNTRILLPSIRVQAMENYFENFQGNGIHI